MEMLKRLLPDRLMFCTEPRRPVFLWVLLSPILTMCLLLPAIFPEYLYASINDDIRLVRSDAKGVTFEYVPEPVHRDTLSLYGELFDVLTIDGCITTTQQGHPQIPLRQVLIGLPPDAVPAVSVVESPYLEQSGYRLAPAPLLSSDENAVRLDPNGYNISGFAPLNPVEVGAIGVLRGLHVLPIALAPVSFNAGDSRIRVYDRIQIDIRFNKPTGTILPAIRPGNDRLSAVFETTIINAEIALPWRQTKAMLPPRRVNSFGPGEWYKITLSDTGFYLLDRETLEAGGLNIANLDPRTIRLFNGGGRTLPQDVDAPRPELREMAVRVTGESDGRFDDGDQVVFYASALKGWAYDQPNNSFTSFKNPYTDTNVYWLNTG
ncbi:uncharacterized protein METZ01_LOCUS304991, partial [marine metagenome]